MPEGCQYCDDCGDCVVCEPDHYCEACGDCRWRCGGCDVDSQFAEPDWDELSTPEPEDDRC